MKIKNLVIILALTAVSTLTAGAQTWYNMWYNSGQGKYEWICNTAISYSFPGIQFTTNDRYRGHINNNGKWFILSPDASVTSEQFVGAINSTINEADPKLSLSTNGHIGAAKYTIAMYDSYWNGDEGTWGYGKNNDITLQSHRNGKTLRIGSKGAVSFWSFADASANDNPTVSINSDNTTFGHSIVLKSPSCLVLKEGRNNDATIATSSRQMRFDAGFYGFWFGGKSTQNDDPSLKISSQMVLSKQPVAVASDSVTTTMQNVASRRAGWIGTTSNHGMELGANNKTAGVIGADGNLYWGFDAVGPASMIRHDLRSKYSVFVKTGILAADYAIAPVSSWADYVFEDSYRLRPLAEVKQYVEDNGHLPDVPSASQVAAEGYSQHEMNETLLRKVEELTLYILQQQKEIEDLKSQLNK